MSTILAIDQGTTSSRALLIHQDGTVLARGRREFAQHFPEPGWVEHDPRELLDSTVGAVRQALEGAGGARPTALGITNQRETVVVWDRKTLEPVGPAIVWQDRRTTERCVELKRLGVEELVRARTGLVIDPYFSATKLEWILKDPEVRRRAERGELAAGTVDSWLVARIAGGAPHVTEPTNASRTMLYRLGHGWDPDLLGIFGIPASLLPRVVPSSGVLAESDPAVLGLRVPIAGLAGDQQAALFGQGCAAPGLAKNTYGTGAFLLVYAGDLPPQPGPGLLATAACGPRGDVGYAFEGSVFIAGAAIQWLRDGLGLLADAGTSGQLATSVPDTGGVYFVPAFVGLGSPHWEPEARGTITGLTRGTSKAHLVRAGLESMAHSSRDLLEAMVAGTGLTVPRLRVDGGATANDWLMQFQADLLGLPVDRPDVVETTALGAAALAGIATGVWPSLDAFVGTRRFRTFEPGASPERRAEWIRGWRRAVSATLHWARTAPDRLNWEGSPGDGI